MNYEENMRLECLRLAIAAGAKDPIDEARRMLDFLSEGQRPAPRPMQKAA